MIKILLRIRRAQKLTACFNLLTFAIYFHKKMSKDRHTCQNLKVEQRLKLLKNRLKPVLMNLRSYKRSTTDK